MTKSLEMGQRVNLDPESQAMLYQGCSTSQLALIFRLKTPDVAKRLGDLRPVGVGRQNNPLYDLAEAAARLVKIEITQDMIDRYMRSINHAHLPPMVSKAYWDGKQQRERYREQANELWNTVDIIRVSSEALQSLRMSIILIPDVLKDEADLNERQFRAVQRIVDEALEDARVKLVTDLRRSDPVRSGLDGEDGSI
jgi:hypothetical protein